MNLEEKVGIHLDQIKQLKGVENTVLTQRDGNPIQSSGVWFSKDEIFNVSSATSAIFNVGIHLHPKDLKYILIEGKKAKILIAPLNSPIHPSLNQILERQGIFDNKHEFFIAITAQPNTNLGGIFLQTGECLKNIKTTLITSGENFKPPLIQFDEQKIQNIIKGFNIKENTEDEIITARKSFAVLQVSKAIRAFIVVGTPNSATFQVCTNVIVLATFLFLPIARLIAPTRSENTVFFPATLYFTQLTVG